MVGQVVPFCSFHGRRSVEEPLPITQAIPLISKWLKTTRAGVVVTVFGHGIQGQDNGLAFLPRRNVGVRLEIIRATLRKEHLTVPHFKTVINPGRGHGSPTGFIAPVNHVDFVVAPFGDYETFAV